MVDPVGLAAKVALYYVMFLMGFHLKFYQPEDNNGLLCGMETGLGAPH